MMRREVSSRRAASQALIVIAESIRASQGRRGTPKIEKEEGKDSAGKVPSSNRAQSGDIGRADILSQSNKENVKPPSSLKLRSTRNMRNIDTLPLDDIDMKPQPNQGETTAIQHFNGEMLHHTKFSGSRIPPQQKSVSSDAEETTPLDLAIAPIPSGRRSRATRVDDPEIVSSPKQLQSELQLKKSLSMVEQTQKHEVKINLSIEKQKSEVHQASTELEVRLPRQAKAPRERAKIIEEESVSVRDGDEDEEYSIESSGLFNQETNPASGRQSGQANLLGSQYQGRWTQEEHDKFIEGLQMFGKDWRRIEEFIGSRTCAQIRSHAQKYFNRLQRDIARGIKRPDEHQMSFVLGKKKKRTALQEEDLPTSQRSKQETAAGQTLTPFSVVGQQGPQSRTLTPFPGVNQETSDPQLADQPDNQITQIQGALHKLTDDAVITEMKEIVAQREQLSLDILVQAIPRHQAGERLVEMTSKLHFLAMQAMQQCKCKRFLDHAQIVDICNRIIDERNLTQFLCILLSRQISILPPQPNDKEIIQRINLTSSIQPRLQ